MSASRCHLSAEIYSQCLEMSMIPGHFPVTRWCCPTSRPYTGGFSKYEVKRVSRRLCRGWKGNKLMVTSSVLPGQGRVGIAGWGLGGRAQDALGHDVTPWGPRSSCSQSCPVQAGASCPSVLGGIKSGIKTRGEEVTLENSSRENWLIDV